MSLLLKALENAAKNREAAGPQADPNQTPDAKEPAEELALEPLPQPTRAQSTRSEAQSTRAEPHARAQPRSRSAAQSAPLEDDRPSLSSSQHQAQAQSVLRAGAPPARPGIFEWLARRPLVAFSTAAGIFAIGYGTYFYLQITNPGIFSARPTTVAKPPAVAANPPPAQSPPPPPAVAPIPPAPAPAAPVAVLPSPAFTPGPTAAAPSAPPAAPAVGSPAVPAPPVGAPPAAAPPAPTPPSAAQTAPAGAPTVATGPFSAPQVPRPATPAPPAGLTPPPASVDPAVAATAPPPVPPAPAPAKITVAPTPPEGGAAARARATKPAPARPGAASPPDGILPSAAGQVVPVSSTLTSAHQALEKGQADEAERLYRQTLASDPRNVDAMLGLAAALVPQNKTDAASQYYMRVLELDPRNAHAQAGLLNLSGRADPGAAEVRLKQLIAREPSAFLYFSLGNLYAEHGQWAPAQAAYFQAHSLAPDNPDYAFNLAVGLEHLSQPRIALNYYRRALALAQSRGHAQFDAGGVQSRIRSLETALAERP